MLMSHPVPSRSEPALSLRLVDKRSQVPAAQRSLRYEKDREGGSSPTRRGHRHGTDGQPHLAGVVPVDDEGLFSGNRMADPRAVSKAAPRLLIDDANHTHGF